MCVDCWAHEVEMGTGESVISNIDLDFGEVKVVLCLVMYSSQTCGHWPMDLMSSTLANYHSLLVFMCASDYTSLHCHTVLSMTVLAKGGIFLGRKMLERGREEWA